jgi:hypothetical protein
LEVEFRKNAAVVQPAGLIDHIFLGDQVEASPQGCQELSFFFTICKGLDQQLDERETTPAASILANFPVRRQISVG